MSTMSVDDFARAACRDKDPELFHPFGKEDRWDPETVKQAKAICRRCPVKRQCNDWAEGAKPAPQGITAGLTPAERRRAREKAREKALEADRKALLRELLHEREPVRRKLYKERVPS